MTDGGRVARLFYAMYTKKGTDPFYNSKKWRHKREAILRRDGYRDQLDARVGMLTEAQTVHHIFPRDMYPRYQWADWNLISLSNANHEAMHNRLTGGLSDAGLKLMQETAEARGIRLHRVTLVVGLPGSGKTTWTRRAMGGGLAFDLDHVAAAFRLRTPHAEYHEAARKLANGLAKGFAQNAARYTGDVFILRAAPTWDEAAELEMDRIVICEGERDISDRKDYRPVDLDAMRARIAALGEWAEVNGIDVERVST